MERTNSTQSICKTHLLMNAISWLLQLLKFFFTSSDWIVNKKNSDCHSYERILRKIHLRITCQGRVRGMELYTLIILKLHVKEHQSTKTCFKLDSQISKVITWLQRGMNAKWEKGTTWTIFAYIFRYLSTILYACR